MDFCKLFPGKEGNLITSWDKFKKQIKPIFNTKIKDKENLKILAGLNLEGDTTGIPIVNLLSLLYS